MHHTWATPAPSERHNAEQQNKRRDYFSLSLFYVSDFRLSLFDVSDFRLSLFDVSDFRLSLFDVSDFRLSLSDVSDFRLSLSDVSDFRLSCQRSFSHVGPSAWNGLPYSLRHSGSQTSFRQALKTHLFQQSF